MEQRGNSAGWRKQIGVIFSRREAKMVKASHSWGGRRFESCHGNKKNEAMTISEKEIREDFRRFIRHEAMRANCSQDEIINIINLNKESL